MKMFDLALLSVCIVLCLSAGFIGSFAMDMEWYNSIVKSPLNPPSWVFGPAWTVLFILMGISLFIVIKNRAHPLFTAAIGLFVLQFVLNVLWSFIFFANQNVGLAIVEMASLFCVVVVMIVVFAKISLIAGLLQIPYALWLIFATHLAYFIFKNNNII